MKKLLALLALISILAFTGCFAEEPEDVEEDGGEEVVAQQANCDEELDYEDYIQGLWILTMTAPDLVIEGPAVFHADGRATESSADVTIATDRGPITQHVVYGGDYGYWEVTGDRVDIIGAGNGMWGFFTDPEHLTGTIIDVQGVSNPWSAYKVSPYIYGDWMMHIDGWADSELSRFHTLHLNEDGLAYTDWVKVQNVDGSVVENEMDPAVGLFDSFSMSANGVTIVSADGDVTFEGEISYDEDCYLVMEGVWTIGATGETGSWYAVPN